MTADADAPLLAFELYASDGLLIERVEITPRSIIDGDISLLALADRQATYCRDHAGYVRCVDLPSGVTLATLDPHNVVGGTTWPMPSRPGAR